MFHSHGFQVNYTSWAHWESPEYSGSTLSVDSYEKVDNSHTHGSELHYCTSTTKHCCRRDRGKHLCSVGSVTRITNVACTKAAGSVSPRYPTPLSPTTPRCPCVRAVLPSTTATCTPVHARTWRERVLCTLTPHAATCDIHTQLTSYISPCNSIMTRTSPYSHSTPRFYRIYSFSSSAKVT